MPSRLPRPPVWLGLRIALDYPNGLSRPTFRPGGEGAHGGPWPGHPGSEHQNQVDRLCFLLDHPEGRPEASGLGHRSPVSHLPSPSSWSMVTVRLVTGDSPPAADAPNSTFPVGCGAGVGLQAKSRRRRWGGSGPSSMAPPGLPGLPLRLPPPPPRRAPPRWHRLRPRATPPAPAGQTQTRPRRSETRPPRAAARTGERRGLGRRQAQAPALPSLSREARKRAGGRLQPQD